MKIQLKCRSSKHRKKQFFFFNLDIFGSGLFGKIYLNCRSSKHCKKSNFFLNLYIFTDLYLLVGTGLNLDPDLDPDSESDPELTTDPNLQIISDPVGSGCTTLTAMHEEETMWY
jgi:hypothetical protein